MLYLKDCPKMSIGGAPVNKQSPTSYADGNLTLRGFQDKADFETIAQIRNKSVQKRHGGSMPPIGADMIEGLVSSPERLCISQVDRNPVGFILVASAGGPRLDGFGTIEGESWLFIGPTCIPEHEGKGIEKKLLDWLVAYAREMGIARLIKFARETSSHTYINGILEEAEFRERLRYYYMQLEMTAPPPAPKELPGELEFINFRGEEDFDLLWNVLEPAFDYLERDADSYEQNKATFESIKSAYFPICLESASKKPIGTIALATSGNRGQIATLGVIPAFQGRGIGSLLMERAIAHAWHIGIKTVDLSVRVENRS
jgi:ribosomal protein S18 acetylase RimI-like enzyme